MDKNVIGLLGGASALALIGGAGAAWAGPAAPLSPARTYAELLDPIPNAAERLKADDQRAASIELAQYYHHHHHYYHHHHHHHHHHHWRWYHHHHYWGWHHHHHHYHHHYMAVPMPGY